MIGLATMSACVDEAPLPGDPTSSQAISAPQEPVLDPFAVPLPTALRAPCLYDKLDQEFPEEPPRNTLCAWAGVSDAFVRGRVVALDFVRTPSLQVSLPCNTKLIDDCPTYVEAALDVVLEEVSALRGEAPTKLTLRIGVEWVMMASPTPAYVDGELRWVDNEATWKPLEIGAVVLAGVRRYETEGLWLLSRPLIATEYLAATGEVAVGMCPGRIDRLALEPDLALDAFARVLAACPESASDADLQVMDALDLRTQLQEAEARCPGALLRESAPWCPNLPTDWVCSDNECAAAHGVDLGN